MKLGVRPGLMLMTLLSALWLGSWSTPVHAADPVGEARGLFEAGVAASKEQRWREARDYFKRSAALYEKPSTLFNLAVVEVKLGLGAEALATLDAFDRIATDEHDTMRQGAKVLRSEAEQLVTKSHPIELIEPIGLGDQGAAAEFEAGKSAYWAGRYEDALESFERAARLSNRPELLYNIGAAADRLRNDERALSALEAYLAADPGSPMAANVRSRVEVLRKVVNERKSQPSQPQVTPTLVGSGELTPPRQVASSSRQWVLLGVGLGAMGGAVGAGFYYKDRVDAVARCRHAGDACTNLSKVEHQRSVAKPLSIILVSVLGAGGIGLVTAGSLLAVRNKKSRLNLSASAAPGEASVWLGGAF
jgi:hypothetical protein